VSTPSSSDHEQEIRSLLSAGDVDGATTLALRVYGPSLLGFLKSRLHDLAHAREAFAWLAEDLWKGMRGFRAESSVRTWAYAIARNVVYRYRDRELRARFQQVPLSQISRASALAVALPTGHDLDARAARLREQLDEDEQTVLTLRVDKAMDWKDIALVMLFDGNQPDDEAVVREAARLRKRFQLLKEKLRKLAVEDTQGS
jgi:RNA polymerase sigma-70 factor (ECF subfamily)